MNKYINHVCVCAEVHAEDMKNNTLHIILSEHFGCTVKLN